MPFGGEKIYDKNKKKGGNLGRKGEGKEDR
jgi:hypothetical protein